MSKADRHKRRAKQKAAWANAVQLAPVPRRKARGRERMGEIATERSEDASRVALDARVRRGAKDRDEARDPLHGTDAGRCILHMTDKARGAAPEKADKERRAITETWASLSSAWENYCTRILGRPVGPQCAAIAMVPDKAEADPSLRIDLRTVEERDAAAKRAWQAWLDRIKALDLPQHRWAVRGAAQGFMGDEVLWRGREPTASGCAFVAALKLLTRDMEHANKIAGR